MVPGFEAMVSEIPETHVLASDLVKQAGYGMDLADKLAANGLKNIPVNDGYTVAQMINRAICMLNALKPDCRERVKGLLFAHSLPFYAPSCVDFFNLCLEGQSMQDVVCIAISGQPCAILHQGVQQALNWLNTQQDDACILLIGADQAYSAEERLFFGSAMGDAAFAGYLSKQSDRNQILSSVTETEIIACQGEMSPQNEIDTFRENNPMAIRHCIESAINKAGMVLGDVTCIVPHTPYHSIWDLVGSLLRVPREKIMDDYLPDTGHFNSNDSFCHYVRACKEGRLREGDIAVLINPGFGGSRGCTVIKV